MCISSGPSLPPPPSPNAAPPPAPLKTAGRLGINKKTKARKAKRSKDGGSLLDSLRIPLNTPK